MSSEDCGCTKKNEQENETINFSKVGSERRSFINYLLGLTGFAFVASVLSPLKMLVPPKALKQAQTEVDNTFKYAKTEGVWFSEKAGEDVKAEDFEAGKGAAVIWRGRIPAILIKLDQERVNTPLDLEEGFAAFAARCTHLCCVANWHLDRPEMDMIFCRCHDGVVDPYNIVEETDPNGNDYYGAAVVSGPVPRPFPLIPVEIVDGKLKGIADNLEWYDYC